MVRPMWSRHGTGSPCAVERSPFTTGVFAGFRTTFVNLACSIGGAIVGTNLASLNGHPARARVLLVSTNRERQPYPVVPNGLACVASALDAAGHSALPRSVFRSGIPLRPHLGLRASSRRNVIGVSVRNIDNSDAIALQHYTPEAREISARFEGRARRENDRGRRCVRCRAGSAVSRFRRRLRGRRRRRARERRTRECFARGENRPDTGTRSLGGRPSFTSLLPAKTRIWIRFRRLRCIAGSISSDTSGMVRRYQFRRNAAASTSACTARTAMSKAGDTEPAIRSSLPTRLKS